MTGVQTCALPIYFEYTMFPSHDRLVVIVIASPTVFHVPMSSGASITLCPIGVSFATLICTSFCFIVFGAMVITPMFVARQLGKHQVGFSWSEESRRYIGTPPEFYWPDKWRKRAENKKQGSTDQDVTHKAFGNFCDLPVYSEEIALIALDLYTDMLRHDYAPEQARMVLPQNMMVNWVWTGSLLGWAQMCKARLADDAQRETQEFARKVQDVVAPLYPVSWDNLTRYL